MNLITNFSSRASPVPFSPITNTSCVHFYRPSFLPSRLSFPFWTYPSVNIPNKSLLLHARKKRSDSDQKILEPTIIEEVSLDDEDDTFVDDLEDDEYMNDDDDYFDDEYDTAEAELYAGDGAGGGGISLAGTWWDKKALEIAEEVSSSFDGDLKIYAFKTLSNSTIQVRIERLTNKSGSPDMEDIQAFSTTYRARLDEAELAKSIPENVSLEEFASNVAHKTWREVHYAMPDNL